MRTADTTASDDVDEQRGGFGSLGSIIQLLALMWAAGIASFPLNDNSFLTHLATGRLILDEGSVPSTDPYTFTAHGEPWTVQSWLASVAFAGAERLAGGTGLRVLFLVLFVGAAMSMWAVVAPARSVIVRLALMTAALTVATELWTERPYMVGVIGFGVLWLGLEGRLGPWLLVPLMWVWVNTHGSWLLGLLLVVLLTIGGVLDRHAQDGTWTVTDIERRVIRFVGIGTLAGAIGPLGLRVLWFPLTALVRGDVFSAILEWQPPSYESAGQRTFLLLFVVGMFAAVRSRSWRLALPAIIFGAGAHYALRNVVLAVVVLIAVIARAAPAFGNLAASHRPAIGRPAAALLAGLLIVVSAVAVTADPAPEGSLDRYPVRPLAWLASQQREGDRLAAQMITGNLLGLLSGPGGQVFIDDRVDMYPPEVFQGYQDLAAGGVEWREVLDRYQIDQVIWERDSAMGSLLASDGSWKAVYNDSMWVVACRRRTGC